MSYLWDNSLFKFLNSITMIIFFNIKHRVHNEVNHIKLVLILFQSYKKIRFWKVFKKGENSEKLRKPQNWENVLSLQFSIHPESKIKS